MENIEKNFGDIMVGDKLYYSKVDYTVNSFLETRILSIELAENALDTIDHSVPDVVITTQDFKITLSKLYLTHWKSKAYVNKNGVCISPSPKYLMEVLMQEVNSNIRVWQKWGENIVNAYNTTISK